MNSKKILFGTLKNVRRSGWSTITSILVMTLTFFVTSVFIIVLYLSTVVLGYLESKAQITAFFKDSATEEKIFEAKGALEKTNLTSDVAYVSKEGALKIYMGQHKNEPLLLESISSNIFPASLDIRAKNIKDLPTLAGMLEKTEGVEEVVYYKDVIGTFQRWSYTAKVSGMVLVGILSLISVLIVLVTVGSLIHSKKEEIVVMRLVGASNWYIQGPFLAQGVFYGAVSSIFSSILIFSALPFLYPYIVGVFGGIPLPTLSLLNILILFSIECLFGILLGVFGSALAVRKYLKL